VDAAKDLAPDTTVDAPAESWLGHRERLAELIHALRVTAPLLHHRVQEDGRPGGIEVDEGCELVVAGIPGALIVDSPHRHGARPPRVADSRSSPLSRSRRGLAGPRCKSAAGGQTL
jgi:hypothetical protein